MADSNLVNLQAKMPPSKRRLLRELDALKTAKVDIKAEAQEFAYLAILTLAEICQDGDTDATRVSAANSLLDRGYGKPKQAIDVKETKTAPTAITGDMTDEEAAEAYALTLDAE